MTTKVESVVESVVRVPAEVLAGKSGKEAALAVIQWAGENKVDLSSDTKVFYGDSNVWNSARSLVVTGKMINGTFRTRLGAFLNGATENPKYGKSSDSIATPRAAHKSTGLSAAFDVETGIVTFATPEGAKLAVNFDEQSMSGALSAVWSGVLAAMGKDMPGYLRRYDTKTAEYCIGDYVAESPAKVVSLIDADIAAAVANKDTRIFELMGLRNSTPTRRETSVGNVEEFIARWVTVTVSEPIEQSDAPDLTADAK